jgi:hypothetical protein
MEFAASRAAMTFDGDCTAGAVLLVLLAPSFGYCNGP